MVIIGALGCPGCRLRLTFECGATGAIATKNGFSESMASLRSSCAYLEIKSEVCTPLC